MTDERQQAPQQVPDLPPDPVARPLWQALNGDANASDVWWARCWRNHSGFDEIAERFETGVSALLHWHHQRVMAVLDAVCDMSLTARQEGRITEAERNAVTDALAVLRTRLAALAPPGGDTHD